MKSLFVGIFTFALGVNLLFAADIASCKTDNYTSERISEEIPKEERVYVYNGEEIVGAFGVVNGNELYSLYLCGKNPGYYYADGSLQALKGGDREAAFLYNDEYEFTITQVNVVDSKTKVFFEVSSDGAMDYDDFSAYFEL